MKNIFEPYLSPLRQSHHLPVAKAAGIISHEQAVEDLSVLHYLMENRYCGWDYYQKHGLCWNACFQKIHDFLLKETEIYISDFCRTIHQSFDVGIVDNHLAFCSPLTGKLTYGKQFSAYFADFQVEQTNTGYHVAESTCPGIVTGDCIHAPDQLFPTLPRNGRKRYLIGMRSFTPVNEMAVTINGQPRIVPLHRCRASTRTEQHDVCLRHAVRAGVDILRATCCDYVDGLTEETDLESLGRQFREKPYLILNYLSNEGGYNRITREFIRGLNGYSHCEEYSMKLTSPVTEEKDCARQWISLSEAEPYDYSKAIYDGTLILLVNSDTASSGESAILYARSCKNLLLIGENTMGCNTFGNVASYELPNSRIVCRIPNVVNLCADPEDCKEGYGFAPDYWVDSEDVEGEVLHWLKRL